MEKWSVSRRRFIGLAGVAGAMVAGIPGLGRAEQKKPVRIGILGPLTGVAAVHGPAIPEGATVAMEEINEKGGILGRKVELMIEDDKFDPAAAAEAAKKLVRRDNVDVLIGTVGSHTTMAVVPVAEAAKKPFIYVIEGEPKACYKYIFGMGPTPAQKLIPFIPFMVENLGKSYYFVGSDYVYPRSVNEVGINLVKKYGGKVLGEEYAPLGTTDFATLITRIERSKPEVLFSSVVAADGAIFIKQANEFGLQKKMKISGNPTFAATFLSGIGQYAEGAYLVEHWYDDLDFPVNKEFVKRYRAKYNPKLPIHAHAPATYASVWLVKRAAEKAKSLEADKLVKAIEGLSMDTPFGPITVLPQNHLVRQNMYILKVEGMKYKLLKDLGPQDPPDKC